jgi:hypothetical protein
LAILSWDKDGCAMWVYFWVFISIPLVCVFCASLLLFLLLWLYSAIWNQYYDNSGISLFVQNCLWVFRAYSFKVVFYSFMNNVIGILMGIALNL